MMACKTASYVGAQSTLLGLSAIRPASCNLQLPPAYRNLGVTVVTFMTVP
jgi:hypothetical protein